MPHITAFSQLRSPPSANSDLKAVIWAKFVMKAVILFVILFFARVKMSNKDMGYSSRP